MEKTAVEWLENQLKESIGLKDMQVIEKAKEMEKEIIRTAYLDGMDGEYNTSEHYYNETFNKK